MSDEEFDADSDYELVSECVDVLSIVNSMI